MDRPARDHRKWSVAAVVLVGCFETPPPTWLLEDPQILALRVEVVEDGPLSTDLAAIPADRVRAEALPGDVLRLRALVAEAGGEVEDADIAWFACMSASCISSLWQPRLLEPCGPPLQIGQGCTVGRGPEATLVMPPLVRTATFSQLYVAAVLGTHGMPTDECIERLQQQPYPVLADCSLFESPVASGPPWKLAELVDDGVQDPGEPPPELRILPPNFNPELERFTVFVGSPIERVIAARAGDRIDVRAGDRLRVRPDYDPRDTQEYLFGYEGEITTTGDHLQSTFYADVAISTDAEHFIGTDQLVWTVPDGVAAVTTVFVVRDTQHGVGWGTLAFDVEGARR